MTKITSKTMFSALVFALFLASSHATSQSILTLKPQPATPIADGNITQVTASCSYTVTITTSCFSPKNTRDQISLVFGDAYGNQVSAPRLEDPSTGTFERCSVDTYDVSGTCLYTVCSMYILRSGYDGWKPKTVQVEGGYSEAPVTFYYDTPIPNNVWYGNNYCSSASAAAPKMKLFGLLFQVLLCIQCCKSLFGSMV